VLILPLVLCLVIWKALVHVDGQVHMCNKLASRHVRVGLASPSEVSRCDICENAPGIHIIMKSFGLVFV